MRVGNSTRVRDSSEFNVWAGRGFEKTGIIGDYFLCTSVFEVHVTLRSQANEEGLFAFVEPIVGSFFFWLFP